MARWPLRTRLLNGHDTNLAFGSSSTTSMDGSASRTYLAAVAPPQPPPTTTTRRLALGSISPLVLAQPASPATASAPAPVPEIFRKCLRDNAGDVMSVPPFAAGKIAEVDLHGGPEIAPKPPAARSAPGNPWHSSVSPYSSALTTRASSFQVARR